jgi:seryl-tRNA synthetase
LRRKSKGDVRKVVALHDSVQELQSAVEAVRKERNDIAKNHSMTQVQRQDIGKKLKDQAVELECQLLKLRQQLELEAMQLPCDSHPDAPVGPESAAVEIACVGQRRQFDFAPQSHLDLGQSLDLFSSATSIAGSGFLMFRNDGVLLEQALINWALQRASQAGFQLVAPPDVAHSWLVEGCGFNPRDTPTEEATSVVHTSQVYSLKDTDLCLIGTSEIALAGLHAGSLLDAAAIPAKYAAVSHCFRREAGANGQRDKGLYRLHQFSKVELFAYVPAVGTVGEPAPSDTMFQSFVDMQAAMFTELGLHFRVLNMPTEELGAAAYKKVDMEAWMPCRPSTDGVGAYGEISSTSNCIDYQSRRLNIRYKHAPRDNRFVHTLNGTACAIPRTMLAILETHQQKDGSVALPPALWPFMGGKRVLTPKVRHPC